MQPRKSSIPAGFRAAPKPKPRPVEELTVRELQDMYDRNKKILSSPSVLFLNSHIVKNAHTVFYYLKGCLNFHVCSAYLSGTGRSRISLGRARWDGHYPNWLKEHPDTWRRRYERRYSTGTTSISDYRG